MEMYMQEKQFKKKKKTGDFNFTGIPNAMKARFEAISKMSLDDVRVHYNSDKPAQFEALAYTQGNRIFVGPGQEKHLEHELGHVIQQKQGIVKPTLYINGYPINDSPHMEQAADNISHSTSVQFFRQKFNVIQRRINWITSQSETECQSWLDTNINAVIYNGYTSGQILTVFLSHSTLQSDIRSILRNDVSARTTNNTIIELHSHVSNYLIDSIHLKLTYITPYRNYEDYIATIYTVPQGINQSFINDYYRTIKSTMAAARYSEIASAAQSQGFIAP